MKKRLIAALLLIVLTAAHTFANDCWVKNVIYVNTDTCKIIQLPVAAQRVLLSTENVVINCKGDSVLVLSPKRDFYPHEVLGTLSLIGGGIYNSYILIYKDKTNKDERNINLSRKTFNHYSSKIFDIQVFDNHHKKTKKKTIIDYNAILYRRSIMDQYIN